MNIKENQVVFDIGLKEYPKFSPNFIALNLVNPNSKVLSLGCGSGREVKFLLTRCKDVTGIDNNEKMILSSKKINPKAKHYYEDIISFLTLDIKAYDYIVCLWNTINYLNKQERRNMMNLCYDRLNKDGSLIIVTSTLSMDWKHHIFNIKNKNYYPSMEEVNLWFKNTGFKVSKIKINDELLLIGEKK